MVFIIDSKFNKFVYNSYNKLDSIDIALLVIPIISAIVLAILQSLWSNKQIDKITQLLIVENYTNNNLIRQLKFLSDRDDCLLFSEFVFVGVANTLVLMFPLKCIEYGIVYTIIWIFLIVFGFNAIILGFTVFKRILIGIICWVYILFLFYYLTFQFNYLFFLIGIIISTFLSIVFNSIIETPLIEIND